MQKKWTKLLSVLCLVAMLISLVPVVALPAAAADTTDVTFTLDFTNEATTDSYTTSTEAGSLKYGSESEKYFTYTAHSSAAAKIESGSQTIGSGADEMKGTVRFNLGGNSKVQSGAPARVIQFTTTTANAKLKIWWHTGSAGSDRHPVLYTWTSGDSSLTTVDKIGYTGEEIAKNYTAVSEYTIATAGTYYLGADKSINFYKVEVTEAMPTQGGTTDPTPGGDEDNTYIIESDTATSNSDIEVTVEDNVIKATAQTVEVPAEGEADDVVIYFTGSSSLKEATVKVDPADVFSAQIVAASEVETLDANDTEKLALVLTPLVSEAKTQATYTVTANGTTIAELQLTVTVAEDDDNGDDNGDDTTYKTVAYGEYYFSQKTHNGKRVGSADVKTIENDGIYFSEGFADADGHGLKNDNGGTVTIYVVEGDTATILFTTCAYGTGGTVKVNGETVTGEAETGEGIVEGTDPNIDTLFTVEGVSGKVVIEFSAKVYVHGLTVIKEEKSAEDQVTYILTGDDVILQLKAEEATGFVADETSGDRTFPRYEWAGASGAVATLEGYGAGGFFNINSRKGTSASRIRHYDGNVYTWEGEEHTVRFDLNAVYDDATHAASIEFTTEAAATVKIWAVTGDADSRTLVIYNDEGTAVYTGDAVAAKDTKLEAVTVELEDAGTYYIGSVGKAHCFYRVEVTTAEIDGMDPADRPTASDPTPEELDFTALEAAIAEAEEIDLSVYTLTSDTETAADVKEGHPFVKKSAKEALEAALEAAIAARNAETQAEINTAAEALEKALADFAAAAGVGTNPDAKTPIDAIEITGETTVEEGKTITLTAVGTPADADYTTDVYWVGEDTEVATVDIKDDLKTVEVTGLTAGTITLKVQAIGSWDGSVYAVEEDVTITVTEKEPVDRSNDVKYILTGDDVILQLKEREVSGFVADETSGDRTFARFEWAGAASGEVATLEGYGAGGFFNINSRKGTSASRIRHYDGNTYTWENEEHTVRFDLNQVYDAATHAASIEFTTESAATVKIWAVTGDADSRTLVIYDANGEAVYTGDAVTAKDTVLEGVTVELEDAGTYYIGSVGKAHCIYRVEVITAQVEGKDPADRPTASTPDEVTLTVTTTSLTVEEEATAKIEYTVDPADTAVTFESADATVATVAADGTVTGVKAGNTTVTVKAGDKTATVNVTVTAKGGEDVTPGTKSITLDKSSVEIDLKKVNKTATVNATVKNGTLYVISADTDVATATVSGNTITITGKKVGDTKVYAVVADTAPTTVAEAVAGTYKTIDVSVISSSSGIGSGIGGGSSSTTPSTTNKTNVNGEKVTTKVASNGDKTITVTDENGEVIAELVIPATYPELGYTFEDVPADHWAAEAINAMASIGVVKGVSTVAHLFDPNSAITRGAMAQILFNLSHGKAGIDQAFEDVAEDAWYADAVAWAAKVGIVNGYSETAFGPEDSITREQLAVMLYRYAQILAVDTTATTADMSAFVDADQISDWAAEAMNWAVANGLLVGKGNNDLDPSAPATRAETAMVMARFLDLV